MIKLQKRQTIDNQPKQSKVNLNNDMYYLIICKNLEMSLKRQIKHKKFINNKRKIMASFINNNDVQQLWMIRKLKPFNNKYQIVHFASDDVIQIKNYQVYLNRGDLNIGQLFQIQTVKKQVYRFKNTFGYLSLDGILQYNDYSEQDLNQQFILQQINPFSPPSLHQVRLIYQPIHNICLDVKNGGKKDQGGTLVIPYQVSYRANQRWVIEPQLSKDNLIKHYYIKSYLTGRYLFIEKDQQLVESQWKQQWQFKGYQDSIYATTNIFSIKLKKYLCVDQNNSLIFNNIGQKWLLLKQFIPKKPKKDIDSSYRIQ